MFYTHLFTSKRGTLARIWLAAHWEKKVTKAQVFDLNLETTVQDIIGPQQVKIGLRSSGHLLLGVVKIYSRKTKYLLADCNEAVVKIKFAFRPEQTDLPQDGMEAMVKAITLQEDFTDFDPHLTEPRFDAVDHFTLNQCRTEDITLKEEFGNSMLTMEFLSEETSLNQTGLFGWADVSFASLGLHGDGFGDEGKEFSLLDFIDNSSEEIIPCAVNETPERPAPTAVTDEGDASVEVVQDLSTQVCAQTSTILVENMAECYVLEPDAATQMKRRKKKRSLLVDETIGLSDEVMKGQVADANSLLRPMEIAPPTRQLMEWMAIAGVDSLFQSFCTPVIHPTLQQLFLREVSPGKLVADGISDDSDPEDMRERREGEREASAFPLEEATFLQVSADWDGSRAAGAAEVLERAGLHRTRQSGLWEQAKHDSRAQEVSMQDVSLPDPPSEESMLPSAEERELPWTVPHTQSEPVSQDTEERRMTNRAQNLLLALKRQSSSRSAVYSLHALCEGSSRSRAAALFFSLLVLKKQGALNLSQSGPYADIVATPGPHFHQL